MLHVLRLSIVNVYLLTGERAILIDAGGPKDTGRIFAFLQENGIETGKLSLILLTHGHWDHAGSAAELRRLTGAPVAIHRADADRVRQGVNGPLFATNPTGWLLRPFLDRGYPPVEPDVLIEEEMTLAEFGVNARVLHTPGHTPGSISVLSGAGDAMVGDLVMGGWFGGRLFPTWPGLHYYAEDSIELDASVKKMLAAAPKLIYPAHGGPLDPRAVARHFRANGA